MHIKVYIYIYIYIYTCTYIYIIYQSLENITCRFREDRIRQILITRSFLAPVRRRTVIRFAVCCYPNPFRVEYSFVYT